MKHLYTIIFCVLFLFHLSEQNNSFFVAPSETNAAYEIDQDDHLVVASEGTANGKLFFYIGGTGSTTETYRSISNFAASLGYDVINLSYPNGVPAFSLTNNLDSLSFRSFRQEICYGTPLSQSVEVDSLNSLNTRAINLLNYLSNNFPSENWDSYLLDDNTLNWPAIAIGGHSQGSGHACYFAKFEEVDRVLMFSGPNDFSSRFSSAAEWLRAPGVTSLNKHFAYLSLLDEVVDFDRQLKNIDGLGIFPAYDTIHVDISEAPYNNTRCLYTTQPPGLGLIYHNSPVRFSLLNNEVWEYMLATPLITSTSANPIENKIVVYPNPTSSTINIDINDGDKIEDIVVHDINGRLVTLQQSVNADSITLDFSNLPNGMYFVRLNNQVVKMIKL